MPNFGFFASDSDIPLVTEYLLASGGKIFDTKSEINELPVEFLSTAEILEHHKNSIYHCLSIAVWYPPGKGKVLFTRIDLSNNLKYKIGDFYHCTEGWALIFIHFGGTDQKSRILSASNLSVNSEKRALGWEQTITRLGAVSDWDWRAIEKYSRAFSYHIAKKLAVEKIGAKPVLPGAFELRKDGYELQE